MRSNFDLAIDELFGSSAAEGCKEGERRWTIICQVEVIETIKFLASLRQMSIKNMIHEIFSEYVEANGVG